MNKIIEKFLHHLEDTILLTSGNIEIRNMLKNIDNISESDIDKLRSYNVNLIDKTKSKLANINTIKVQRGQRSI